MIQDKAMHLRGIPHIAKYPQGAHLVHPASYTSYFPSHPLVTCSMKKQRVHLHTSSSVSVTSKEGGGVEQKVVREREGGTKFLPLPTQNKTHLIGSIHFTNPEIDCELYVVFAPMAMHTHRKSNSHTGFKHSC